MKTVITFAMILLAWSPLVGAAEIQTGVTAKGTTTKPLQLPNSGQIEVPKAVQEPLPAKPKVGEADKAAGPGWCCPCSPGIKQLELKAGKQVKIPQLEVQGRPGPPPAK